MISILSPLFGPSTSVQLAGPRSTVGGIGCGLPVVGSAGAGSLLSLLKITAIWLLFVSSTIHAGRRTKHLTVYLILMLVWLFLAVELFVISWNILAATNWGSAVPSFFIVKPLLQVVSVHQILFVHTITLLFTFHIWPHCWNTSTTTCL